MSTVDLVMDMETLSRVLTQMKVPKELHNNYTGALAYLDEHCGNHPDCQAAKKLIKSITSRLD